MRSSVTMLLPVAIAILLPASMSSAQNAGDEAQKELFRWAREKGAEFSVELGYNKDGIRGIFATRDIQKGEDILSIPQQLLFAVANNKDGWDDSILKYIRESHSPCSRWKPYLDAHPKPGQVTGACVFPREYLPMLQSKENRDEVVASLNAVENMMDRSLDSTRHLTIADVTDREVSLEEMRHACHLVGSHTMDGIPRPVSLMIPIFDLCNYVRGCPHVPEFFSEDNHPNRTNYRLVAGANVAKGEEICYDYGVMEDDHAVLQYGFLPPVTDPPMLHKVDAHYYSASEHGDSWPVHFFPGTDRVGVHHEIHRLQAILSRLTRHDETYTNPPPLPGHEYLHGLLVQLQQRRRLALQVEIKRLQALMQHERSPEL